MPSTRSGKHYHPGDKMIEGRVDTPIPKAPSRTRSGTLYGNFDSIDTVVLDIDAEPFFQRALLTATQRGDEDDTEGREFEDEDAEPPISRVATDTTPVPASDTPISTDHDGSVDGKRRRQLKSKARRRANLNKHYLLYPQLPVKYRPRLGTLKICSTLKHTAANIRSETLPSATGCWVGKRLMYTDPSVSTVRSLDRRGLRGMFWSGANPIGFYDNKRRLVAVLAGKPNDGNWGKYMEDLSKALNDAREKGIEEGVFKHSKMRHRRGRFFAIPTGVSFGTGSKKPGNLKLSKGEQKIVESLKEDPNVKRVVGFQHASFACYAPKLYQHYRDVLAKLYKNEPHLRPHFPRHSHFPAITFNLGPDTATVEHTDCNNVAHGWCAITALGNYDPSKEGHIILYDLGLYITFPPGSTILIPSAVFRHGNTPLVCKGSYRQSITQYCAGGLFRWVRYGFKTVKQYQEELLNGSLKQEVDGDPQTRLEDALSLFSTIDSLEQDRIDILRT